MSYFRRIKNGHTHINILKIKNKTMQGEDHYKRLFLDAFGS
jgi:hypothetical protein